MAGTSECDLGLIVGARVVAKKAVLAGEISSCAFLKLKLLVKYEEEHHGGGRNYLTSL